MRRSGRQKSRAPLTRDRVLRAAIGIADKDGIDAVTMRRLGHELGVEAMSLYHHVASKDDVVEGMADLLVSEIPLPPPGTDWKAALRARAMSARAHLSGHPWAFRLIWNTRGLSPSTMDHHQAVIGDLIAGGLSNQLTHTAMHVLGSRTFGFADDLFLGNDRGHEAARKMLAEVRAGKYPVIANALVGVHHDDDLEFAFALDLILDGLERARDEERRAATAKRGATVSSPR